MIPRAARPVAAGNRPVPLLVRAIVVVVTPGAASDGNALCTVNWDGARVDAAYSAIYTPVVGHDVLCVYQAGQLVVLTRIIGTP